MDPAIRLVVQCTGKVVLLGVGKSGLIARKIAATDVMTRQPRLTGAAEPAYTALRQMKEGKLGDIIGDRTFSSN